MNTKAKFTARWSGTSRQPTSERRGPRRAQSEEVNGTIWGAFRRCLSRWCTQTREGGRCPDRRARSYEGCASAAAVVASRMQQRDQSGGRAKDTKKGALHGRALAPSLPSAARGPRSSFVWTGRLGEGRFIVDRPNSDRFSLVATRARSASGARALHFTVRARLFSYFTVATSTFGVAA